MRKFLTTLKKYSLIVIGTTAALGVLLIAFPEYMLTYSALFVGIMFIICGLIGIISYAVKKDSLFALTLGIISAISGLIICIAYKQIMTVMVFLLGIILLVGGVTDLVTSVYVAISRRRSWILTVLLSVASIGLGIAAISNPFDTQNKLLQVLGAGLVIFAIVDLISYIQIKVIAKQVKKKLEEEQAAQTATEVDFADVTPDSSSATEVDYVEVDEN